jgi:hypothetical protein
VSEGVRDAPCVCDLWILTWHCRELRIRGFLIILSLIFAADLLEANLLFGCATMQGEASGFEACARALLGEAGRAGKVNAAVGVMQVGAGGGIRGQVEGTLFAGGVGQMAYC